MMANKLIELRSGFSVNRLAVGLWQNSSLKKDELPVAVTRIKEYFENGWRTFDGADIYPHSEYLMSTVKGAVCFTKFCQESRDFSKQQLEQVLEQRMKAMKTDFIDLLQVHWWNYHVEPMPTMFRLKEIALEKKNFRIGLTNFDTHHIKMFVEHGIDIVSNQVQFSIVDRRPETEMIPYCKDHKVFLLTYGTLCGGFLTDRYLGKPEPKASDLNTPSLRKYFNMIKRWGSWKLFQELLSELRSIADRHKEGDFSIANVAMKYILDKPAVACVLVGARLLYAEHMKENEKAFSLTLEQQDLDAIEKICAKSNDLFKEIGDCGNEYR